MYAIVWATTKFEFELKGRRFKVETDHKALEQIRTKPSFSNNRINRWIERLQEFDFSIEYKKGKELVAPDALSRMHGTEDLKEKESGKNEKKGNAIRAGKWKVHVIEQDNKKIWKFDSGKEAEIPLESLRKQLVVDAHYKIGHKGIESTYYELKSRYYWPGIKNTIKNVIKKCEKCCIYNEKKRGGCEFVESTRKLEKVALDLIEISEENKYVFLAIDYFTRVVWGDVLNSKSSDEIVKVMDQWIKYNGVPEEIISDQGKEFTSIKLKKYFSEKGIKHRMIGVESHRSNGRIERCIRTMRQMLLKNDSIL